MLGISPFLEFAHPWVLTGLALIGVPIVIHLIMRQKPKHLLFPAMRFLAQKIRTNQRKLQLRHLLLLLLRILLILLICLALAGTRMAPDLFGDRFIIAGSQPVAVAVVIDTSPSMEYKKNDGKTRLAEAKQRALELLADLPPESRVAVFDSADAVSGHWSETVSLARKTIGDMQIRYANRPVTDILDHAYALMPTADEGRPPGEPLPRFLYVFSDRTRASWDENRVPILEATRDSLKSKGTRVRAVYVDVGEEKPHNLAVTDLKLPRQVLAANEPLVIDARVQATGRSFDTSLLCRFDDEKDAESKPIKLAAGQSVTLRFQRQGLKPGMHRAEVALESPDNLPCSAARFATVEVRGPRQVLIIADELADDKFAGDADEFELALKTQGSFKCDVISTKAAVKLGANDLAKYQAVCLLDVARPPPELWEALKQYVTKGGGLAILPGGGELDPQAYTDKDPNAAVSQLMPGVLEGKPIEVKGGAAWKTDTLQEPFKTWFRNWDLADPRPDFLRVPPLTYKFWPVKPRQGEVVVSYADKEGHPAVLERSFDRKTVRGRVVLFTTPMDGRKLTPLRGWNDYLTSSFFVALANKTAGYLAGDDDNVALNFLTGQTVTVPLPAKPRFLTYTLQLPGRGPATTLTRPEADNELRIGPDRASLPGSYTITGKDGDWKSGFSLNVPEPELQLDRIPKEKIEQLFGPKSVVQVGATEDLRKTLESQGGQVVPLVPWLMILLLLVLAVENLLANRFYRRPADLADKEEAEKKTV